VLLRASALDAQQPQAEDAASLPPRSALAAR
jgi:xanthine dehydrogenase accessory factor